MEFVFGAILLTFLAVVLAAVRLWVARPLRVHPRLQLTPQEVRYLRSIHPQVALVLLELRCQDIDAGRTPRPLPIP